MNDGQEPFETIPEEWTCTNCGSVNTDWECVKCGIEDTSLNDIIRKILKLKKDYDE